MALRAVQRPRRAPRARRVRRPRRAPSSQARLRRRQARRAVLLLLPSILFLAAFTYWPIGQALVQSLTIETFGSKEVSYGLGNYQRALGR